jgi:guanosine-3',5'-bis(diphosphate) 3'-pyrophosphohydrolase
MAEPHPGQAVQPPVEPPRGGSARGVKAVLQKVRPKGPGSPEREALLREVRARRPKADLKVIERAYELAERSHQGQLRKSGDPFLSHPVAVAQILAELGLDDRAVAAALLHDSVEDTPLTLTEVDEEIGHDVARLIDGVTKLDKIRFRSPEQSRAENLRKMIVATATDVRVIIIKIADRLHNMRTLAPLSDDKRLLIARETLEIYAPLAHRLGMYAIKWELEDLAFATLHPKRYEEISALVDQREPERERVVEQVHEEIQEKLKEVRIKAEVSGRPKHLYSIYEKIILGGKQFNEIFDLVALRVVVDSVKECYAALGALHTLYTPVPGRFKDYIAMPKFNMYQSLHTTVMRDGHPMELQIRTQAMHRAAESGIAAHWLYKEQRRGKVPEQEIAWLQRMMDWQRESADPAEFMESLRIDLYQEEVFVFTPKGDVLELPRGATPVDFAYSIHTEVGHRTVGARVNGKLVALSHELESGDTIEIITAKGPASPSRDWLKLVKTPRARNKIRQWFARERREDAAAQGRDALMQALRKQGLPVDRISKGDLLEQIARELNFADVESMYVAMGESHISPQAVTTRIVRFLRPEQDEDAPIQEPKRKRPKRSRGKGVIVEGMDDLLVRLARCCTPVPGDPIVGFMTRGRGVSVHRQDCPNAKALAETEAARMTEVWWDNDRQGTFSVAIEIEALDRAKLLRDVTSAISDQSIHIISSSTRIRRDGIATLSFTFELADPSHLDHVIQSVRRVESVYDVYRVVPQAARA